MSLPQCKIWQKLHSRLLQSKIWGFLSVLGYIFTPKWAGIWHLSAPPHPQTVYCRNSFPSNFGQEDQSVFFFFASHPAHTYRVEVVLQTLQTKNRRLITPVQLEYRMEVPYWESQTGKTRDLFSLLRTPFIEHGCHSWRSGPLTPPTDLLCKVAHKFCEGKEVDHSSS